MSKRRSLRKAFVLVLCFVAGPGVAASNSDCRQLLAAAFSRGVNPATALVFHGTAVEAIEQAFDTGRILPSPSRSRELKGAIYVFGNPESKVLKAFANAKGIKLERQAFGLNETFRNAEGYAADIGKRQCFLSALGMATDAVNKKHADNMFGFASEIWTEDREKAIAYFVGKGVSRAKVDEARAQANEAKGIVISFHPEILETSGVTLTPAFGTDDGLRLYAPKGIPLRLVEGIEPMGNREYKILDCLTGPAR